MMAFNNIFTKSLTMLIFRENHRNNILKYYKDNFRILNYYSGNTYYLHGHRHFKSHPCNSQEIRGNEGFVCRKYHGKGSDGKIWQLAFQHECDEAG